MSKRPPSQPQEQPTRKRIVVGGQSREKYETANRSINPFVQALLQSDHGLQEDATLAAALVIILQFVPPEEFEFLKRLRTDEARDLIAANPDLRQALQSAIDQGCYDEVMSLPILRKEVQHATSDRPQPRGGVAFPDDNLDATSRAFQADYIPGFPEALLETVDKYHGVHGYNNSISIIQSSGTGKSRGALEVARLRFSFLFNLRRDLKYYAYPPPDVSVRDYFFQPMITKEIQKRYAAFLCSLFACGTKWLKRVERGGVHLAEWWYRHLNDRATQYELGPNRLKFYGEVVEGAKRLYEEKDTDLAKSLQKSCEEFVAFLQSEYQRDDPSAEPLKVACILVFDEAQELAESPKSGNLEEPNYLHHLGPVFNAIVENEVFSVFLSTNPNVRLLSPPVHFMPLSLHPPITELPFDVFARDLNDNLRGAGNSTLSATSSVDVMACFGRTLWYSLHSNGYKGVIDLALAKLNPTRYFSQDQLAQFACLAIRIGLDFDASREIGRTNEIKLVESYMRIVFAVPEHREYMRTGTPSEPILAEAAAQLLNPSSSTSSLNQLAPYVLADAFQKGFLARGERGEMVGRLLWTLAHDGVLRKNSSHVVRFHKPIRVIDFLYSLFHKDHWGKIRDAKPVGDVNGATLSQAFNNAYIHFSHFVDGMDYNIELQHVYQLLLRGAALSFRQNQRSIDFLTPILFGSPDSTELRRSNTSVLQSQVMNPNVEGTVFIDPNLVEFNHPVLSLVHKLGTPNSSVEIFSSRTQSEAHARHYRIDSYGCTSQTFGVIPQSADDTYKMLLDSDLLMEDFPRSDVGKCKSLLRQLEPCTGLERGQECVWFGEKVE